MDGTIDDQSSHLETGRGQLGAVAVIDDHSPAATQKGTR